jgi:prolyl-tRNA synthetase
MKFTEILAKTQKSDPKEEKSINAKLLTRAGFINKSSSGIYTYLTFGLRTLRNIENIVRDEMSKINAEEVLMPALHSKENWEKTGRWDVKEMFKIEGDKFGLGWTHEEIITPLAKEYLLSEKDFPNYVYQIQSKFRNEPRAKSGVLRGREFIMKDLYSFHLSKEDLDNYYERVKQAYLNVYARCGLKDYTFYTYADGGAFSEDFSHEFQTVTDAGEDIIYICEKCGVAMNKEVKEDKCLNCGHDKFKEEKAIEVGNIFKLNDKYSKAFDFKINDKNIIMGCYGIGISRLMGAIVEVFNDEKGIIWPKNVSPFDIYLIGINDNNKAEQIEKALEYKGISVLNDNREKAPKEKFTDADLIGIPIRIVVSEKTLEDESVEIKLRTEDKGEMVKLRDIYKHILDLREKII